AHVPVPIAHKKGRADSRPARPSWPVTDPGSVAAASRCGWTRRSTCRRSTGPTAAEVRLLQMRDRVDVTQLAVLDPEHVRVRRTAAAVGPAGTEGAPHHYGAQHFIDHKTTVGDVHARWHARLAGVLRRVAAGEHAALDALAGIAPWHQVDLRLEEGVEIGVGRIHQRRARVATV